MRNKYIYLSSLDSNDHADFEVNFPEQVIIAPYSQVRCVSARINPSDNLVEIDDTNDLFYVGIDHWNKVACSVPLLPIRMNKALYNMEDVNSPGLSLTGEIESKLNEQLKSFCLVRGGGACSINANRKLSLSVDTYPLYGCPTGALTANVLKLWQNQGIRLLRARQGNSALRVFRPINDVQDATLGDYDGNTYYGVAVRKNMNDKRQYHLSPPIVTGLTQATDASKHISHIIELDFTVITDLVDGNLKKTSDYIRFYFGALDPEEFGDVWGVNAKYEKDDDTQISHKLVYYLEFSNKYCALKVNTIRADGSVGTVPVSQYTGPNYKFASKFKIKMEEWDNEYAPYMRLAVDMQKDGQGTYDPMSVGFDCLRITNRLQASPEPNRIGIVFSTHTQISDSVVVSMAVDDPNDQYGWNKTTNAFGARNALDTDLTNRFLSVLSDNIGSQKDRVGSTRAQITANSWDTNDIENEDYTLDDMPNADILSWDANTDQGVVYSTTSKSSPLQADGAVSGNNRDYPGFYLEIPSLPLENVSASYLKGFENKFICPIELSQSVTVSEQPKIVHLKDVH